MTQFTIMDGLIVFQSKYKDDNGEIFDIIWKGETLSNVEPIMEIDSVGSNGTKKKFFLNLDTGAISI